MNWKLWCYERGTECQNLSRIRKRLVTIWNFPYICFEFRCVGETQLTTEKCMEQFKLWLDAFVCCYMPKILAFSSSHVTLKFSVHNFFETTVLLKIFDAEFRNKLSYFCQDGGENRGKAYQNCFSYFCDKMFHVRNNNKGKQVWVSK